MKPPPSTEGDNGDTWERKTCNSRRVVLPCPHDATLPYKSKVNLTLHPRQKETTAKRGRKRRTTAQRSPSSRSPDATRTTPHTSHPTHNSSHLTLHTSHLTPSASHLKPNPSHPALNAANLKPSTSSLNPPPTKGDNGETWEEKTYNGSTLSFLSLAGRNSGDVSAGARPQPSALVR